MPAEGASPTLPLREACGSGDREVRNKKVEDRWRRPLGSSGSDCGREAGTWEMAEGRTQQSTVS